MDGHQQDFHQIHFDSIQALRGITALFIVLEHVRFLNCGAFGVDIFFCISGFMIMFSTHRDTAYFLRKRLIRILPPYYLMTVGTFLLLLLFPGMFEQSRADVSFLVKSLLFIPFDIGGGVLQPLMRIGWTVNCEIFFYILFFISMRISHRFRGLLCGLFLTGITAAAALLPSPPAFLAFYGNPVMLEFLFGITAYYGARGLYRLYTQNRPSRSETAPGTGTGGMFSKAVPALSLSVVLLCFLWLIASKPTVNILGFRRPVLWGLPALIIVMGCFLAGLYVKRLPLALVRLGDISFSLYLMHYYPVMLLDRAVFDFSSFSLNALVGTAAAVAVSVSLAFLSWELLEKRFCGWLRGCLERV